MTTAPENLVKIILGFGLYNLFSLQLPELRNRYLVLPFGIVAGILGGAYNAYGPPVVIYGVMRGWGMEKFRATLQGYFLVSNIAIVIGHGVSGLWSKQVLVFFLVSIPAAILAVLLREKIVKKIPEMQFDRALNVFLVIAGLLKFF